MNSPTGYRIARENTDVAAEVMAAGPPPMPSFDGTRYALRRVDPQGTDPEMLSEWFARPHLVETWEQPWSAARWHEDSSYRLAGDYSLPCILSVDGTEIGYVELYRAARDEIARIYSAHAHDVGLHVATADTRYLGRGVVSEWMRLLPSATYRADPDCRRMMIEPAASNTPMRKALDRIGWTFLGEFDIRPDRRIALYRTDRA
ncbi:GNAT family N-acetyltransferase [Mycobacteroides abscessus]|uniref:GNAT family N-acetyltransferase n=1 Tax=Mycobacteroides abscessus TaxID=36809 RepID=UPI0009A6549E|nr:GNAT family N-acetyltransferase [Mycobacteroides abscessus]MDM2644158.1 GNAT family N-acetyltransferase [Mycobacteroides abscessus]MDM2653818.1 GNAT family N-acetyltransferase [Mycobacteroides abscessus]MDM2664497.1 GNAT family N-acetyltransferase [Mycobacteroides abscessus]MDM2666489.1 GNAT family N-acetyltransferase [Mycobacteroides abscessus]MDM2672741.1 GNAT family N-acetyltransferase [Mycobacteroides abscessus]